jgi:hypothetical protein
MKCIVVILYFFFYCFTETQAVTARDAAQSVSGLKKSIEDQVKLWHDKYKTDFNNEWKDLMYVALPVVLGFFLLRQRVLYFTGLAVVAHYLLEPIRWQHAWFPLSLSLYFALRRNTAMMIVMGLLGAVMYIFKWGVTM